MKRSFEVQFMSTRETVEVRCRGLSHGESRGTVTIERWARGERFQRGLKGLGAAWLAAVLAIFIPGLHFILVPSLLLVGPIVFFLKKRTASLVMGGSGICPECGESFTIVKTKDDWPFLDICEKCRKHVRIERI